MKILIDPITILKFSTDQLSKDVDLSGVEIIEKDQKLILQARIEVEKQAKVMLQKGLEAQNQSQVIKSPGNDVLLLLPSLNFALFRLVLPCKYSIIWEFWNQPWNPCWKTLEKHFSVD